MTQSQCRIYSLLFHFLFLAVSLAPFSICMTGQRRGAQLDLTHLNSADEGSAESADGTVGAEAAVAAAAAAAACVSGLSPFLLMSFKHVINISIPY
jgi:hypothetical protein